MVSNHAMERGIQRINNNSLKKNIKSNMKKIMRRDAYERYFAYSIGKSKLFRYVKKDDLVYKYILDKFTRKIITVHTIDFNSELMKGFNIKFVGEFSGI